jgi:hypothetical protein
MHKEAPMTKQQKEDSRLNSMFDRDKFDEAHLGNFRRCYPHPEAVSEFIVANLDSHLTLCSFLLRRLSK